MSETQRATVKQCATCPWKVDCDPEQDIPQYDRALHCKLENTIQSGVETLLSSSRHIMVCHYAEPGAETPCAGWLANQLGPGNNIGLRMAVSAGKMPGPRVSGKQHQRFEDTLP